MVPELLEAQASFLKDTMVKRDKTEMRDCMSLDYTVSVLLSNYLSTNATELFTLLSLMLLLLFQEFIKIILHLLTTSGLGWTASLTANGLR